VPAHVYLGRAYDQQGAHQEAIAEFRKALELSEGNSNELAALGQAYALARQEGEARKILAQLQQRSQQTYVQPMWIAVIHIALGEKDQAHDWMEKAYQDRSAWLVYLNAQQYQNAIDVGTEMVRVDTAMATADYYSRLAAAYLAINQAQKASEVAALAARKYPNDCNIQLFNAQGLYKAGQLQQAEDAAKKAVACNPKNAQGYFLLATIQSALNKNDDLAITLQTARTNGADPGSLSQLALKAGSDAYKAATASKEIADYQKAIKFLQLSDQLQSSADAKFLIGASAFSVGQTATISANEKRSCDLARTARDAFNLASLNLPAGGQKYPNEAAQLLTAIPQFTPAVENEVKRFCK